MFKIKAVEKIKTHIFIFCNFFEIGAVYEISVEKCVGARGATNDNNLAHARYLLEKQGYTRARTYTLRFWLIYCFFTATMVTRTRLSVTLYVHCLYCC